MTGEHLGLVEGRWGKGWTAGCRCLESNCTSTAHPTPKRSPVMTARGHVNVVGIQLRPLSPSPTPSPLPASHTQLSWQHEDMWMSLASSCDPSLPPPPPLPASHTHLSWQHEDMWTSSASSCTRVALAWSTKRGWGPGLPRASWLHTPASSNVASRKCFCLQTAHRTDLGDGVLLIFNVFCLLVVVVLGLFFVHVCYPTPLPPIMCFVKRSWLFKSLCFRNYHHYYYDYIHCQ